jgi:hypothetical protein
MFLNLITKLRIQVCLLGLLLGVSGAANATFHLFQISKLYSNADGTVQFIELAAFSGGQQFIAGHTITSAHSGDTTRSFTFPSDLPGDTTNRSFLIGTQGFAALNVVTPDFTVPNGFLFTANGLVTYGEGADSFSYASLPTSGGLMLNRSGTTSANVAKNFASATGSVSAAAADYTGAWYNASESGWGLSIIRGQSGAYGIIMYHYNQAHNPTWYFMSGGNFNGNVYTTPVTLYNGPWFGESFSTIPVTNSPAGTASINFTSDTTGVLTYTITGAPQVTRNIAKLQF